MVSIYPLRKILRANHIPQNKSIQYYFISCVMHQRVNVALTSSLPTKKHQVMTVTLLIGNIDLEGAAGPVIHCLQYISKQYLQ